MKDEDWKRLQGHLIAQFRLGRWSAHDQEHWRRVEHYGLHLGRQVGGDLQVIRLFAWLHDSQRFDEGYDPEHGPRAAEWALQACGNWFELEPPQLDLLMLACRDHERGLTSSEPTVACCWDADRLDLDRVAEREQFLRSKRFLHLFLQPKLIHHLLKM